MMANSLEAWLVKRLCARVGPELTVVARRIRRQAEDAAAQREGGAGGRHVAPGVWDTQLMEADATHIIYQGRGGNSRHELPPEDAA